MKKLILCLYLAACTGSSADDLTVTVQNIGLQQNVAVPPLGAGVAPVLGFPGDGTPVVTRVGGWSSGPGAIKWHGGQWVIPHTGPSNTSIANVSCDVVPRSDATDLIELIGNTGTAIASMTIPATTANIIIRGWLLPSVPYSIGDGENIVIRHTPRDSITGAFTSASQDMTVISCAVNATAATGTFTDSYSVGFAVPGPGVQLFPGAVSTAMMLSLNTSTASSNLPLKLTVGKTLTSWSTRLIRNSSTGTITARLWRASAGSGAAVQIGSTQNNTGPVGAIVFLGQASLTEVVSPTSYFIEIVGGGSSGDLVQDYQDTVQ